MFVGVYAGARSIATVGYAISPARGSLVGFAMCSLLALIVAPLLAVGLTLFWLAPLIHSAEFFVTRPMSEPLFEVAPEVTDEVAHGAAGYRYPEKPAVCEEFSGMEGANAEPIRLNADEGERRGLL